MKDVIAAQQQHVGENVGEMSVISILRRMPKASASTIAEMTHLSSRQIERILARLKQEGKIARHGSARNGYWEIIG